MSTQISTAFVQQYTTNVMMLLQQHGSRLRSAVTEYAFTGKAASMAEQFGSVSPVFNQGRHTDTPLISTPQDKRWIFPNDADWADLIDNQDKLRMLIDPAGPYAMAGAWAMGRAMDDAIINGFFNLNYTGENGTTSTDTLYAYNSNSQSVAATTGGAAACGLNVAKLRAAKKILLAAEVDVDTDPLFIGISAQQNDNLLGDVQVSSLDYNNRPVLVDGKIMSFMGFQFIHTERIPGAGSYNSTYPGNALTSSDADGSYVAGSRWMVPCWAKSGMALGLWNDIQTTIDRRPDKRNSTQVYVTSTVGGARLEEKRCVIINCK